MKDLEQLIQYLDGELTDVEKQQLTEKMKNDPSLIEKIATLKDVDNLLCDKNIAAFEQSITEVETAFLAKQPDSSPSRVNRKLFMMQAAAVVIVVVSVAIYFLFYKNIFSPGNDALFAAYYQKLPAEFGTRSVDKDGDRFINAIKLYNENRYPEAITEFTGILKQDPSNNAARLFLGICFTETNDFKRASDQFKNIVKQQDPIFEEHAMWYLALCYIKTQHPELAKPLLKKLVDSRSFYMGKASDLLRKLK